MQTYPIKVIETSEGLLLIEAESEAEAIAIAENDYSRGHCPMHTSNATYIYDKDAE